MWCSIKLRKGSFKIAWHYQSKFVELHWRPVKDTIWALERGFTVQFCMIRQGRLVNYVYGSLIGTQPRQRQTSVEAAWSYFQKWQHYQKNKRRKQTTRHRTMGVRRFRCLSAKPVKPCRGMGAWTFRPTQILRVWLVPFSVPMQGKSESARFHQW